MSSFRKWSLRFSFLLLLIIGIGIGLIGFLSEWAQARITEEVQRIKERGESLDLSDLVPPPVPDEENGFLLNKKAEDCLVEATLDDNTALSELTKDPFGTSLEYVERVEQWVENNQESLRLIEEGLSKSYFRSNIDYSIPFNSNSSNDFFTWPNIIFCRYATNLFYADSLLHLRSGRQEEAFESCFHAIRFANTINVIPTLLSHMVSVSVSYISLDCLKLHLKYAHPSSEECNILLDELTGGEPFESMALAIQGERCLVNAAFEQLKEKGSIKWLQEQGVDENDDIDRLYYKYNIIFNLEHAWHLEEMSRYIEALSSPNPLLGIENVKNDVPWYCVEFDFLTSFGCMDISDLNVMGDLYANVSLARLSLILIRHWNKNSCLPDTIEELHLDTIPLDPFSGLPFIYHKLENGGFIIYSIGINGKDYNGKSEENKKKGDIVWSWSPS